MNLSSAVMHMHTTVKMLATFWRKNMGTKTMEQKVFHLPNQDSSKSVFKIKYNAVQRQLQTIAGMDDLLSGIKCLLFEWLAWHIFVFVFI